jgi:hypothetical protein
MISLTPPYHVIQGYTLLPDHEDPHQYYVLPPAPALALEADGCPLFSLVQFLAGGAGAAKISGGLLTMTTQLSVSASLLAALASKLADLQGENSSSLRVAPVLYDSGTVELIALGSTSSPPPEGTPQEGSPSGEPTPPVQPPGPFLVRFLGAGRPSLGGDNRAVFQLVLDETAAELIQRALEAPDLPLIAIYRLNFAALRPSYEINIQADWSKFYHSLQDKAKANLWIVSSDVDRMIEETLLEQNIRIKTDVFGTGEGAQAAADRAGHQLIEWILERFFVPQADPGAATANSIGKVIDDTVWSLVRSVLPGVGYRLREIQESEQRMLSARMEEAVAEVHQVIPQGTLGGMLNNYRVDEYGQVRPDWPARRARLLTQENLTGFPRLEVQTGVEDRFKVDGLAQVQVDLERLDNIGTVHDQKTLVFRSAAERQPYIVNLLGQDPSALSCPFRYRTTVKFDPAGPFGQHSDLQSDWQNSNVTDLYVEPRSVYRVQELTIAVAPTFSFSQFPAVTIELRYSEAGGVQQSGRVELKVDAPQGSWRYAVFGASLQPYEYRLTYHRLPQNGGVIITSWQTNLDKWLFVPDPMPVKRTLNLFTSLPWPDLMVAFVQLRYDDKAHGIHYDEQIDLNNNTPYLRRDYPIHAQGPLTLAYRLTLLLTSGDLMEGSWRETDDDRLVLDRRLVDNRRITVRILGGNLAQNKLSAVTLGLQVSDPVSGQPRLSKQLTIQPGQENQPLYWEYLIGDPPAQSVQYAATFVDNNGFVTEPPAAQTQTDLIILHLPSKTVSV